MSKHEYPVSFEILDAAVHRCLSPYAGRGWVEFERKPATGASAEYRLWLARLGELGKLTVRSGTESAWLEIDGPTMPAERAPTPEELAELEAITDLEANQRAGYALHAKILQEALDILRQRTAHQRLVINDLLYKLQDDPALATASRRRGGRPRNTDDDWAWEQVNVAKRDRADVYGEWLERIKKAERQLADPHDSFDKATRPSRRQREKTE